MKIKTTSSKVRNAGYLTEVEGAANAWFDGCVATTYGFVIASSYGEILRLRFIWRGRLYHRRIERPGLPWTAQGIVRPAKQFAAEITGGSA